MLFIEFIAASMAYIVMSIVGIVWSLQQLIGPAGIVLLTLAVYGWYVIYTKERG